MKAYEGQMTPASEAEAVTSGVAFTGGECKALACTTGGTATVTFANGDIANFPLVAGYNPIRCTKVAAFSGVTGVFALY